MGAFEGGLSEVGVDDALGDVRAQAAIFGAAGQAVIHTVKKKRTPLDALSLECR